MKIRSCFGKRAISLALCLAMLLSAVPAFAESENSGSAEGEAQAEAADPTPTEDPHTSYYYDEPRTNGWKDWPQGPLIEGRAACCMDLRTGAILYAKNETKKLYPASITKIMTCLLAAEHLNMEDHFVMSHSAAYGIEPGSSSIYAEEGEEFTVEQAMMALMLESANEMAMMLGELVSGNEKKFTELMNERAREIGCTKTHFNNTNGLPDKNHFTTALDMAQISYAAWHNPLARSIICTNTYEIPPTNIQKETRYFLNHHRMMPTKERYYEGVLGGKTGYTNAAGNTLVTFAQRGNMSVVVVVMKSIDGCYGDTAAILDYVFGNFTETYLKQYPTGKTASEPAILPDEKYIIRNMGMDRPFYYTRNVVVTLPNEVSKSKVKRVQIPMANAADKDGTPYIMNEFYYRGQLVGRALQYEQLILPQLITGVGAAAE